MSTLETSFKNLKEKYSGLAQLLDSCSEKIDMHDEVLEGVISRAKDKEIKYHHILLFGTLSRSKNLSSAIIRELPKYNIFAIEILLRAQLETLTLLHYVMKNPAYIKTAVFGSKTGGDELKVVNIMTMLKHLDKTIKKAYNGQINVLEDYSILCEVAHPNFASHFTPIEVGEETESGLEIEFFSSLPKLSEGEVKKYLSSVIFVCDHLFVIAEKLDELFSQAEKKIKEKRREKN